jgi:predicted nuclease of predicted toxin-antitoxin system
VDFKIDENLPAEAGEVLRDAGHDAVSVLDQRLGGRADADIAAVCKAESRALVTLDTDFANILAYPPAEFAGIVVLRTDDQAKPTVLRLVRQVLQTLKGEPLEQRLWVVEPGRIRVRGPE